MNPINSNNAGPGRSNFLLNIGESISESKRQIRSILIRYKAFYEPCSMDDIRRFTDCLKEGYDKVFDEFIAETLAAKSNHNVMKDETDSNDNYIIISDEESQSSSVSKEIFPLDEPSRSCYAQEKHSGETTEDEDIATVLPMEHCYYSSKTCPPQSSSTSNVSVPDFNGDIITKRSGSTQVLPKPAEFVPEERYPERNVREQILLLYEFLTNGIDAEDVAYIKRSYESLLQDDQNRNWLSATHFMEHCVTDRALVPPPSKKRKNEDDLKRHITGSARTEGYYKTDPRDKMRFKYHYAKSANDINTGDKVKSQLISKLNGSREARLNQRRMSIAFGAGNNAELLAFKQLKWKERRLKFTKSADNDWGLFAMEPIAADEMVVEYVGEMIRPMVANLREMKYKASGIEGTYMFGLDSNTIIDATKQGNFARFIRHSHNANCYTKIITVESEKKIVICSKKSIDIDEEITYDHQIDEFEVHFWDNNSEEASRRHRIQKRPFKCTKCRKRFMLRIGLKRHHKDEICAWKRKRSRM